MGFDMQEFTAMDQHWMQQALRLGEQAKDAGEVPVGAVLVLNNEIIGTGYNHSITHQDPTCHAEIMALRAGAKTLNNYRLLDTTLYVTLEPCLMCAGAMIHARIKRLVYGACDPKTGVVESRLTVLAEDFLNHHVQYQGGLMAETCGELLSTFFQSKRQMKLANKTKLIDK